MNNVSNFNVMIHVHSTTEVAEQLCKVNGSKWIGAAPYHGRLVAFTNKSNAKSAIFDLNARGIRAEII